MKRMIAIAAVMAAGSSGGCVNVSAPDKPIEINLNINVKQEVVYRLDNQAKTADPVQPGDFLMHSSKMFRSTAAAVMAAALSVPRDRAATPTMEAARAAGQVGEQPDGYLGIVGAATPTLSALVNHVNIQRKAVYTREAARSSATVEDFAFTSGCNLILQTAPGEQIQRARRRMEDARPGGAPERDSRCV